MESDMRPSAGPGREVPQPWIDELNDEQLVQFAHEFDAARPDLPAAALQRISELVETEMRASPDRRKVQSRAAVGSFVVALTLAVVGILAGLYHASNRPSPQAATITSPKEKLERHPVNDQFVVNMAVLPPDDGQADSLIPVEQYRSLTGGTQ